MMDWMSKWVPRLLMIALVLAWARSCIRPYTDIETLERMANRYRSEDGNVVVRRPGFGVKKWMFFVACEKEMERQRVILYEKHN